jgi:hypothetical protein
MKTLLLSTLFFFSIQLKAQVLNDVWALAELNSTNQTDAYPYISDDGLRLYFVNNDLGSNNVYYSSRPDLDTDFSPKELLDSSLFSGTVSCWFTANELEAYFSSGVNLYHATRPSTISAFGTATEITLIGGNSTFIGGPTLSPGKEELYFYNSLGLLKYEYTNDSTYTYVSDVLPPTGYEGKVGQLSKDGLELYMSLSSFGNDSMLLFKYDRLAIGSDFLNPIRLNSQINGPNLINSQPSYATAANVLVWVRNDEFTWDGNDLYIAQNSTVSIEELSTESKELVKIVDLMGRETVYVPGVILIYIYSDGTAIRKLGMVK